MESILENYKKEGKLHHGYLLLGDIETTLGAVEEMVEKISGLRLAGNPDYFLSKENSLSVKESRRIKEAAGMRGFSGKKRFFVIAANTFSEEAQNALLKILEEPIEGNHFFVITERENALLPTVRSRLAVLKGAQKDFKSGEYYLDAEKFLSFNSIDRLIFVKKFLKDKNSEKENDLKEDDELNKEDEDTEVSPRKKTAELIESLEFLFSQKYKEDPQKYEKEMCELLKMESYSKDPAFLPRLILEYLSFLLPIF